MPSPRPDSPDGDRLQRIIDGVYQETINQQRLPYKARQSNVRKLGRVASNLGKASIDDDTDSEEIFVPAAAEEDTMAPSPTPPPAKKRKCDDSPLPSSLFRVDVTLANGIDPVDFTMTKHCALEEVDTIPKLKKLFSARFPHELNALKTAPDELKLLAYRFSLVGESEWTAITTQNELRDYMITVKDSAAAALRLQICILEEDAGVGGPKLLGRAGKNLRGETVEKGAAVEEDDDDENTMILVSRKQQLAWISDEMSLAAVEGQLDAANIMLYEKDEEIKALKEKIKAIEER